MASGSRTIKVKFDGDQSGLDRATKQGERTLSRWNSGLDKVAKSFGLTRRESDKAVTGVNAGLTKVDSQIKATQDRMSGLLKKFADTGDVQLLGKISRDRSLLSQLEKVRKQFVDLGDDSASGFAAKFSQRIGPLLLNAPISPPILAAVGAAAPLLSATIAGAVTAGVGIGVVGAGVKLAAKDPAVTAAGKELGDELGKGLADAAKPFVPATLKAIDTVKREFRTIQPELAELFEAGAGYLEPLTRGAAGFVRDLLPGLQRATDRAEPLVEVLGSHGPKAADALSDALGRLSESAGSNAIAIDAALNGIEGTIRSTAVTVDFLSKQIPVQTQYLLRWYNELNNTGTAWREITPAAREGGQGFVEFGEAAAGAKSDLELMRQSIDAARESMFGTRSASRDMQAAIDAAAEAVKRDGAAHRDRNGAISDGNAKGREYNGLLDDLAAKTNTAADAIGKQTGSQSAANKVLRDGRAAFIELAQKMGMSASAATALAAKLFAIPSVKPKITVENQQALNAIAAVTKAAGKIKDIHRGIYYTAKGDLHVPGGTQVKAAGGYVRGPGSGTSDSIPARLSNGEYVLRSAAVRQLGTRFLDRLNAAGPGTSRRVLADRDYLGRGGASGSGAAPVAAVPSAGGTQVLETHIHVGDEVERVTTRVIEREQWRTRVGRR